MTTVARPAPSPRSLRRSRRARRRVERRIIAATAFMLLVLMRFGLILGVGQFKLLAALMGVGLLVVSRQRPMATARFAVVWIPLSPILLSLLFKFGLPSQLVQTGTYIRSAVVISLALSGWNRLRASGRTIDVIDRLGLVYVAIVGVYLLAGPFIESTPLDITTRFRGVQSVVTFVLAFLAIRWLDFTEREREELRRWITGVIALICVAGLYQRVDQAGFNRILFNHIDIDTYFRQIAKLSSRAYGEATAYYFTEPPRVASLSLSPFAYADLMLCGIALGITGMTRRTNVLDAALLGGAAVGVFFSDSRIAIIAMGCAVLTAILSNGVSELAKIRFVLLAVVAALALMPLVIQSRLVQADDNTVSDEGHSNELLGAIEAIIERPLGNGVGSEGGISRRFSDTRTLVSGNAILSLGLQVGAIAMVAFLAMLAAVLLRTRARHVVGPRHNVLLAQVLLVASIVSSMTHNTWQEPGAGTTTWILIGLAMSGAADRRSNHRPEARYPALGSAP